MSSMRRTADTPTDTFPSWAPGTEEITARLMALTDALSDVVVMEDPEPRVVFANPAARTFYNSIGINSIVGMHCCEVAEQLSDHVVTEPGADLVQAVRDIIQSREVVTGLELQLRDGRLFDLEHRPVHGGQGQFVGHMWRLRDRTEEVRARREVEHHSRLYRARAEFNQAIIRATDPGELLLKLVAIIVEFGGLRIAWVGEVSAQPGLPVVPVAVHGIDHDYLAERLNISADPERSEGQGPTGQALRTDAPVVINDVLNEATTRPWHALAEAHAINAMGCFPFNAAGLGAEGRLCLNVYAGEANFFDAPIIGLLMDLAHDTGHALDQMERDRAYVQAKERIHQQLYFDPVTGLPNRYALHEALEQAVATCHQRGHAGALIYIDLDRFKRVNDSLGHSLGDRLLRTVGQRLQRRFGREATVAHLVADEFVILLPDLGADSDTAQAQAAEFAERARADLDRRHRVAGHPVDIRSSIGVTLFPFEDDDCTSEMILGRADIAMYAAKNEGGGVRGFHVRMQERNKRRLTMEHELRQALEQDDLEVVFQPQHRIRDNVLVGGEALLRWHSESLGPVSPAEFIPLAEEAGLVAGIGDWVLNRTLANLRHWLDSGLEPPEHGISVNVSPIQFRQFNFIERVNEAVEHHGVPPEMLVLEITESAVINNVRDTVSKMRALRESGIRFAMDDFGTGYSSLTHLSQLPLDTLKIDRVFISGLDHSPQSAAIVDTILAMSRNLGLYVVAEGVETEAELNHLAARDCHACQGFFIARPLSVADFSAHIGCPVP